MKHGGFRSRLQRGGARLWGLSPPVRRGSRHRKMRLCFNMRDVKETHGDSPRQHGYARGVIRDPCWAYLLAILGCGGKTVGVAGSVEAGVTGAGPAVAGACTMDAGLWGCSSSPVDASSGSDFEAGVAPAEPAPLLPPCQMAMQQGASCTATESTIDTTNANQPVHISMSECLDCRSSGIATEWACVSGSWQPLATFACSP